MAFDTFVMPNGLRVVGEKMPGARTVAVGLYVGVGSRYEPAGINGISHFIEHMVFKGTKTRSTKQIAVEMDRIGGQINAYTAKDCTCFYTRTLPCYLSEAMDVVCELAFDPVFDPVDLEKEKGVVIEEIAMADDDPEDVVHELIMPAHFGNCALARPILGTKKRVESFTREKVEAFHRRHYTPDNMVFSIAGNYEWQQVLDYLERFTGMKARGTKNAQIKPIDRPIFSGLSRNRRCEQTHLCLGFPGVPINDPRNYELSVISTIYGGAMSSRLFQHIREDLGLAYNVYSEMGDYTDCGLLTVYAAVNPDRVHYVFDEIMKLTNDFAKNGVTHEEFEMARDQLNAEIILGNETVSSRMQSNGRRMHLLNITRSEDDLLARLNAVRFEDVNDMLKVTFMGPHSTAVVGKNAKDILKELHPSR